jgi:hypothetical protein
MSNVQVTMTRIAGAMDMPSSVIEAWSLGFCIHAATA